MTNTIYRIASAIAAVIMLSGSVVQADYYPPNGYIAPPPPQQQATAPQQGDLGLKITGPRILENLSSQRLKRDLGVQLVGQNYEQQGLVNHLLAQTLPPPSSQPTNPRTRSGFSRYMRRERIPSGDQREPVKGVVEGNPADEAVQLKEK
ncbi:hypothetical protein BDA99DRAFT_535909 [Phascolomyces articulosus]|uniref:Uncharacterized protein n=1 Tax=Phascolomyces articulosus TaxID=60185 RepID=A0AAD5K2D5_9FUNG|nr:hypothetical protein BDA99DRAFT_535909 [Phascolomyces articulosus]